MEKYTAKLWAPCIAAIIEASEGRVKYHANVGVLTMEGEGGERLIMMPNERPRYDPENYTIICLKDTIVLLHVKTWPGDGAITFKPVQLIPKCRQVISITAKVYETTGSEMYYEGKIYNVSEYRYIKNDADCGRFIFYDADFNEQRIIPIITLPATHIFSTPVTSIWQHGDFTIITSGQPGGIKYINVLILDKEHEAHCDGGSVIIDGVKYSQFYIYDNYRLVHKDLLAHQLRSIGSYFVELRDWPQNLDICDTENIYKIGDVFISENKSGDFRILYPRSENSGGRTKPPFVNTLANTRHL